MGIKRKSRRSIKANAQDEFLQSAMSSVSSQRNISSNHLMVSDDDDSLIFVPFQNNSQNSANVAAAPGAGAHVNRFGEDDQSVMSSYTTNTASAPSPTRL